MKKQFERPLIKKIRAGIPSKFGMSVHTEPITHIEDVPVADLVKKFGSPVFVISEKTIRKHSGKQKEHLRQGIRRYSLPGRIKPTTSMQYAKSFTRKDHGQK